MNIIDESVTNEFKVRIKLDGTYEDSNIRDILNRSTAVLLRQVGTGYTIEEHPEFKELVFERSRYVYNDATEFFNDNFQSQITLLQMLNPTITVEDETTTNA